jgi:hypothetical protein
LASATTAEARDLFRVQQVEELAPPPQIHAAPAYATPYQASPRTPYQASQKMLPYQASQKHIYAMPATATHVRYVQHHPHKRNCCGCQTSYKTTLTVYDPCNCCMIEVPVCLPGCCTDTPSVGGRGGLFGQGITNYYWRCGFNIRVVVSKRGDVTVHYYGV